MLVPVVKLIYSLHPRDSRPRLARKVIGQGIVRIVRGDREGYREGVHVW